MRYRRRIHFPWQLLFVVLLGAGVWAALAWPRINDVATSATREYPDLQSREYFTPAERVFGAAQAAATGLRHWSLVGTGSGPGGWSLQALHSPRPLPIREEISIKISRRKGATLVSVRSRSTWFRWDFGQNARNIRAFQKRLDQELFF
jgi:hypothetical protein